MKGQPLKNHSVECPKAGVVLGQILAQYDIFNQRQQPIAEVLIERHTPVERLFTSANARAKHNVCPLIDNRTNQCR